MIECMKYSIGSSGIVERPALAYTVDKRDHSIQERCNLRSTCLMIKNDILKVTDAAYTYLKEHPRCIDDYPCVKLDVSYQYASTHIRPVVLGCKLGVFFDESVKGPRGGGASRFEKLIQDKVVREIEKLYQPVGKLFNGHFSLPARISRDYHLGSVDVSYARIDASPAEHGFIFLDLIINRQWHRLLFEADPDYVINRRILLPFVRAVSGGQVEFTWSTVSNQLT